MTTANKSSPVLPARAGLGESAAMAPMAPMARLTDHAIAQQLNQELKAMRADPDRAKSFLVKMGLITPKTGKLTKRFGG